MEAVVMRRKEVVQLLIEAEAYIEICKAVTIINIAIDVIFIIVIMILFIIIILSATEVLVGCI